MPSLLLPRWTVKPSPGTDIDRTHPLCPDHCWPFLSPQGTALSLARGRLLSAPAPRSDVASVATKSWKYGRYGLALRHTVGGDRTLLINASANEIDAVFGVDACTMLVCFRPTTITGGSSTIGNDTGVASQAVYMLLPWSDNTVYWNFGTVQLSGSAAGIVFGDDLWIGTAGPRGLELWQNGRLITSVGTVPTHSIGANLPFFINSWTQSKSPIGDIALVMTWRRQLTVAGIRALSVNPWQVFQPPPSLTRIASGIAASSAIVPALLLAP